MRRKYLDFPAAAIQRRERIGIKRKDWMHKIKDRNIVEPRLCEATTQNPFPSHDLDIEDL
jgi:hypothetical protein